MTETSSAPSPRANPDLVGHDAAEATLRRLFDAGRLPHALLITGPRGIGKATLAFRLARFVLASGLGEAPVAGDTTGLKTPPDSGVFRRVAAGGHADLLTVERAYDARRRRLRGEIVVDDAREIAAFLRLTPAEGGWRVVVIDGADEMNRSAANAVLKILEEPPQRALLLLVAHSPGRLLPTIRSRCRRLALSPLLNPLVRQLLGRYRSDLAAAQVEALTALAAGSIGRALEFTAAGGLELCDQMLTLLSHNNEIDPAALHGFADRLARPDADEAYHAVGELLAQLLAGLATAAAGARLGEGAAPPLAAVVQQLGARAAAAQWAELREQIGQSFARTDALNLDRKQTILSAFFAIEAAAR